MPKCLICQEEEFVFYMYLEIPAKNKERDCCTVFRGLIN